MCALKMDASPFGAKARSTSRHYSILLKKAGGFQIVSVILFVGTWIESEHNDEMLAENERIVWQHY
jgi:hypothetical protein